LMTTNFEHKPTTTEHGERVLGRRTEGEKGTAEVNGFMSALPALRDSGPPSIHMSQLEGCEIGFGGRKGRGVRSSRAGVCTKGNKRRARAKA